MRRDSRHMAFSALVFLGSVIVTLIIMQLAPHNRPIISYACAAIMFILWVVWMRTNGAEISRQLRPTTIIIIQIISIGLFLTVGFSGGLMLFISLVVLGLGALNRMGAAFTRIEINSQDS